MRDSRNLRRLRTVRRAKGRVGWGKGEGLPGVREGYREARRCVVRRMVIKASEWARGDQSMNCLLGTHGQRCCLGIYARLLHIPDDVIRGHDRPDNPNVAWPKQHEMSSNVIEEAVTINDYGSLDEEKIHRLRPLFAELGVSIVWRPDL